MGIKNDPKTPHNNLALDKNDFSTLCRSFDATTITLSIDKKTINLNTRHLVICSFRGHRVVSDRENESPKGRLNNFDESSNCLGPAECAKRLNNQSKFQFQAQYQVPYYFSIQQTI